MSQQPKPVPNWSCENKCPELIALNVKAYERSDGYTTFQCLYCGGRVAYHGPVCSKTMWRKFGIGLLK